MALTRTKIPIRAVLADDHAVLRSGIREFIADENDIQVIAEASDGLQVITLLQEHMPDVVLLDSRLPVVTCVELTCWIRERQFPLGVLILTAYEDDPFVFAAVQAGADGYVLKNAEAEQISAAVRHTYENVRASTRAHTTPSRGQIPGRK